MATVDEIKTRIEAFIAETNPNADISPGSAVSELVVKLAASVQNEVYADIDEISAVSSLKKAEETGLDTEDVVDQIISNFNVTRKTGTKSKGKIKVIVTTSRDYILKEGIAFVQPITNLKYLTPTTVTISPTPLDGEIQLSADPLGFSFIVDVEAEDVGEAYQAANRTAFSLENTNILPTFVKAEAFGNFSSAQNLETNRALIDRMRVGLSAKTLTNKIAIQATLADEFNTFRDAAVIGVGSPLCTRASHNIFGLALPGYADVYVRATGGLETQTTNKIPQNITVTVVATATDRDNLLSTSAIGDVVSVTADGKHYVLVSKTAKDGFWQEIDQLPAVATTKKIVLSDELHGFYEVEFVEQNSVEVEVQNTFYSYELPAHGRNDITESKEARFSKYQTAVLFVTSSDSTNEFVVGCSVQPNIAAMQDLFITGDKNILCADYLVKAAIPCFVAVKINIASTTFSETLDVFAVRSEILSYVNSLPFGADLAVSKIIDICHNYDIARVDLPVTITGRILTPSGTTINLSDNDILQIKDNFALGVSKENTSFFSFLEDIQINITE